MSTATKARTPRLKTVRRGPLVGLGTTVTEAKADLSARVDAALEGTYSPTVITHKGNMAILIRDPFGWSYVFTDTERLCPDGARTLTAGHGAYASRAECFTAAARHVLDTREYHVDEDIPAFLTDRAAREDLIRASRWNRAFLYARANGMGEEHHAWHRWAGENDTDPRFI